MKTAPQQHHVHFGKIPPLNIDDFTTGSRTDFYMPLFQTATAVAVNVPFIVVRGAHPGPTLGISAAVHGNELNGIRIIHAILEDLDPTKLHGAIICAPVVNVWGYNLRQRYFIDGVDLNSTFPGKREGTPSQQFAQIFSKTFLAPLNYLVDIHTASEGRLNTMYVRADLESEGASSMAMNINPLIVLNSRGSDKTLRAAARSKGIPAITVEAGNPSVLQGKMVFEGELGIRNVMRSLGLLDDDHIEIHRNPVICDSSSWLRTTRGGLLRSKFSLGELVQKGQILAEIVNMFGAIEKEYKAPRDGIVIGMAADPVAMPGTRYCHLGVIRK